jgi:hypothetical protein
MIDTPVTTGTASAAGTLFAARSPAATRSMGKSR